MSPQATYALPALKPLNDEQETFKRGFMFGAASLGLVVMAAAYISDVVRHRSRRG